MPLVQHGDRTIELADEIHVVLDDQHGVVAGQAAQQGPGALSFLLGQTSDGLIHQQHVGILGQQHGDLEPLLLAVGQAASPLGGMGFQTHHRQQLLHPVALAAVQPTEQQAERGVTALHRQLEIAPRSEVLIDPGRLKLAADAEPSDAVLGNPQQGAPSKHDIPFGGSHLAGDHIEEGGFTGTIGADHGPQLTGSQREIEVVERPEAIEADAHLAQFEHRGRSRHGHGAPPGVEPRASRSACTAGSRSRPG